MPFKPPNKPLATAAVTSSTFRNSSPVKSPCACEMICYYKKTGKITQSESNAFQAVNFTQEARDQDWIEREPAAGTDPAAHFQFWLTVDSVWRYETSRTKISKYYYDTLVLGTTRSAVELQRRLKAALDGQQEQPQQQPSNETPTFLLPL